MTERPDFTPPRWPYHCECGACGHRRTIIGARAFDHRGRETGMHGPSSPGGPMDEPCAACGTTDPDHLRRYWVGADTYKSGEPVFEWRYIGRGQPVHGYRVPHPDGPWPPAEVMQDITHPNPVLGPHADQHAGELPPVGGQLTIAAAA